MKYVPSALIGQLSRSQGSTTASRNRFGSYFRNRVTPTNPNTEAQTAQRVLMAGFSEAWRALTDLQRAAWTTLGQSITRQDSLGETYTLTGLQAYVSINRNRAVQGLGSTSTPPLLASIAAITSLVLDAEIGSFELQWTPALGLNEKLLVEATRQVSAGIGFMPRSEYKVILVTAAAQTSPIDTYDEWEAIYGAATDEMRVFYRVAKINTNGWKSAYQYVNALIFPP